MLVTGLRANGVDVVERHRAVWERTRHKAGSFLGVALVAAVPRWAMAWVSLMRDVRDVGPVDAVVAGYPAQADALPARLVAWRLRAPLVVDAMVSLADTFSGDRRRGGRLLGTLFAAVDRLMLRVASVVMVDTSAHADFFSRRFGVASYRIIVVPVGAEVDHFPRAEPRGGQCALFYGKLAPLHGVETVLTAAVERGVPRIRLIGSGQLSAALKGQIGRARASGLEHVEWVEYEALGAEIAGAAICLGIFGTGEKAARVIPNKVFQAMAVGRPVITGDTPAIRDAIRDGVEGILVPPGDAPALARAMRRLAADPPLAATLGANAHARFLEIGHPAAVAAAFLRGLGW